MRKTVLTILLSFVLLGCAASSQGAAMPAPAAAKETSELPDRESMLRESREMIRAFFPGLEEDSRFFFGTMDDAETILAENGSGIILLSDPESGESKTAVKALQAQEAGAFHVLLVNAMKEKNLGSESWNRFLETLGQKMPAGEADSVLNGMPVLLFIQNGEIIAVQEADGIRDEAMEEAIRRKTALFEK